MSKDTPRAESVMRFCAEPQPAYYYLGAHYCEACVQASDLAREYLRGPRSQSDLGGDTPRHCQSWEKCVNMIQLDGGPYVGAWLGNKLAPVGVEYVRKAIRQKWPIAPLWEEIYRSVLQDSENISHDRE